MPADLQMEGIEPSSMDFQSTALPTKLHLHNPGGERWDLNPHCYGHNITFYQLNYFRLKKEEKNSAGSELNQ